MIEAGLANVIAPVNLITVSESAELLTASDAWQDIEFEVALDSGSVVHVCSIGDCKRYRIGESVAWEPPRAGVPYGRRRDYSQLRPVRAQSDR